MSEDAVRRPREGAVQRELVDLLLDELLDAQAQGRDEWFVAGIERCLYVVSTGGRGE